MVIRKRVVSKAVAATALCTVGSFCNGPAAQAHRRDFPFTYDWYQPSQGEKEIEPQTLYRRGEHTLQQQVEFEYGISKRFMIAPYVVFDKEPGDHLRYSAWKVESRYQLGKFQTGKILPGLYLEYEKPKGASGEIETKLILSRYDKRGGDWSLNLIAERPLESGAKFAKTFSFGYARPLGKSKYDVRGGFEVIRDKDDGRINAGPVLGLALTDNINLVGSYGFPITHRPTNQGEFRLLAEYEWF